MAFKIDVRIATTLLFLVMLFPAGCSLAKHTSPSSSSNPELAPPKTAFHPSGNARQDVHEAFEKLKTAFPYRLTETSTYSGRDGSQTITRTVEFSAADRSHYKMGDLEGITYGDKSYLKSGDKWTETARPPRPAAADLEKLLASLIKEVQPAGNETVNGVSCTVYTVRFEGDFAGKTTSGTGKLWIGNDDGLLHQNDSASTVAGFNSTSHIVYEYDPSIKVEKPVP